MLKVTKNKASLEDAFCIMSSNKSTTSEDPTDIYCTKEPSKNYVIKTLYSNQH